MNLFTWDSRLYSPSEEWAIPPLPQTYTHRIRMNGERLISDFIHEFLAKYRLSHSQGFEKLLILSHGSPGYLQFSNGGLNYQNVNRLQELNGKVKKIKIVGCSVAQGSSGFAFCTRLASVTNTIVTASTNTQMIDSDVNPNRWEGVVQTFNSTGIIREERH